MSEQDRSERRDLRRDLLLAAAFAAHGLDDEADAGIEETLSPAAHLVGLADRTLHALIAQAREKGATWAQIGELLGMTRQAAQKRFQGKVPQKVSTPRPTVPQERIDQAAMLLDAAAAGRIAELESAASAHVLAQCGERGLAPQFETAEEIFGSFISRSALEASMLGTVILVTARERRQKRDARAEITLTVDGTLLGLNYGIAQGDGSE